MSVSEFTQALGAVASLIAAVVAALAWLSGKAAAREASAAKDAAREAKDEARTTGKTVDGRMAELLEATRENAALKATQIEKAAQMGREADAVGEALMREKAVAAGIAAAAEVHK